MQSWRQRGDIKIGPPHFPQRLNLGAPTVSDRGTATRRCAHVDKLALSASTPKSTAGV